jgi:hypothetical protein
MWSSYDQLAIGAERVKDLDYFQPADPDLHTQQ